MQNTELQPTSDAAPGYIAVDETVTKVNDERRWLYAAVARDERISARAALSERTTQLTVLFLRRLQQHVPVNPRGDFD